MLRAEVQQRGQQRYTARGGRGCWRRVELRGLAALQHQAGHHHHAHARRRSSLHARGRILDYQALARRQAQPLRQLQEAVWGGLALRHLIPAARLRKRLPHVVLAAQLAVQGGA